MKWLTAGLTSVVALSLGACSLPFGLGGPPSAQDILSRPGQANLSDAHFSIAGTTVPGAANVDLTGQGDVVFKPSLAFHLTAVTNSGPVSTSSEMVSVGGATYERVGAGPWARGPVRVVPSAFSAWAGAASPRYLDEETVAGAKAWHVAARAVGGTLDLWVRESDGFPLRSRVGQLVVDYSHFNSGVKIKAPAVAQAVQATARIGAPAHLNGVDVTVASVDLNYLSPNKSLRAPAGSRYVVAEVDYALTGLSTVDVGPQQWRLTGAGGAIYGPAYVDRTPPLAMAQLTAPAPKAKGFVAYQVPAAATALQLIGTIGSDTVTVQLA